MLPQKKEIRTLLNVTNRLLSIESIQKEERGGDKSKLIGGVNTKYNFYFEEEEI